MNPHRDTLRCNLNKRTKSASLIKEHKRQKERSKKQLGEKINYFKRITIRLIAEFSTVNIGVRKLLRVLRENIHQPIIQVKWYNSHFMVKKNL